MEREEIFRHIDHTLLRPDASWREVAQLCAEAQRFGAASACVAPSYVARARQAFPGLALTTVIGFPLGYQTTAAKAAEARDAIANGATELDMVIDLGSVKDQTFDRVTAEIAALRAVAAGRVLKVIVETCYLTEPEKIALCRCVSAAGADYIKTSTGFGPSGAALADIALFRAHLDDNVRIKAAGGIRTEEEMRAFLCAGAARLGCSAGVKALFPSAC